jgi:hypothetical protein
MIQQAYFWTAAVLVALPFAIAFVEAKYLPENSPLYIRKDS